MEFINLLKQPYGPIEFPDEIPSVWVINYRVWLGEGDRIGLSPKRETWIVADYAWKAVHICRELFKPESKDAVEISSIECICNLHAIATDKWVWSDINKAVIKTLTEDEKDETE